MRLLELGLEADGGAPWNRAGDPAAVVAAQLVLVTAGGPRLDPLEPRLAGSSSVGEIAAQLAENDLALGGLVVDPLGRLALELRR